MSARHAQPVRHPRVALVVDPVVRGLSSVVEVSARVVAWLRADHDDRVPDMVQHVLYGASVFALLVLIGLGEW